ncbi:MAG: hypothetical protein ACO1O6_02980 [Bacteroidota bacterium]
MSILVNIENYEAFYLDYLEGSLDQEQMHAFLLFLDQHPELKLEEDLPSFAENAVSSLAPDFIAGLKVFDAAESITEANYAQFMIASVEQILPATKQVELQDFIARRGHLEAEMDLYRNTKLIPDTSLVYENKTALKRGRAIPMYVRLAAVAAGILLILTFIPWNTAPESILSARLASLSVDMDAKADRQPENPQTEQAGAARIIKNKGYIENPQEAAASEPNTVAVLQPKKVNRLDVVSPEKELVALNLKGETHIKPEKEENSYLGLGEMKNPVPFITREIKTRFNQDVDLRTAKASKTKQGGFYLKIGKFEFSRKTAPVTEDMLAANP